MAISTRTSPLSLAKAINSAHARWSKLPNGEAFTGTLLRAVSREGRRNRAEALQHLQSAAGRLATVAPVKTADFAADCTQATAWDEACAIRKAIALLGTMPASLTVAPATESASDASERVALAIKSA